MTTETEIADKFWKSIRSDMTMMLGLPGLESEHSQPMTAQFDDDRNGTGNHGPIWFFAAKDSDFVREMGRTHRAVAHFASKGHDLFATIDGHITADNDPAVIDRLWNSFVAAWYPGGKTDPNLQLLRFETDHAQVWLNEHSLLAGVKMLLGHDPKEEYRDKTAALNLH